MNTTVRDAVMESGSPTLRRPRDHRLDRRVARRLLGLGAGVVVLASCSGDPSETVIVSPSAVAADTAAANPVESSAGVDSTGGSGVSAGEASATPAADEFTASAVADSVPEVGTPGLDSDDAFCAGWSAWAGSQQVVAVTANFADPASVPSLEVIAAPTMVDAYDSMLANWPAAIANQRDLGANEYFGPMYNRSNEALAALTEVGADAPTIESLNAAWITALEQRDPTTPEISVDLPDADWTYVDDAAAMFSARVPALLNDDTLYVTANTDAIDGYITETCPDRGTLGGFDIVENG